MVFYNRSAGTLLLLSKSNFANISSKSMILRGNLPSGVISMSYGKAYKSQSTSKQSLTSRSLAKQLRYDGIWPAFPYRQ
jgi:hypothetical protein